MRKTIDKILETTLIILMSVMVINVLWQVFSRYIIGIPSSFTDELARYLLIWVGLLGATYMSSKNQHIAIDLISSRFGIQGKKRLKAIINLVIISFVLAVLVIGGSNLVYITFILKQYSAALQIPLALVYMVLPISGLLIIYYKIFDLLTNPDD